MARCARAAGSNSGFTLLEVILAVSLLATASTAIIAVYIRDVKLATAARDLTIGSSIARNALNEGLADYTKTAKNIIYDQRPSLSVDYENEKPKEVNPLTKTVRATVTEQDKGLIVSYLAKRAIYELPESAYQTNPNGSATPDVPDSAVLPQEQTNADENANAPSQ
jgi:prepilin-type N-terminal cleavage/methylation domain-containing protein